MSFQIVYRGFSKDLPSNEAIAVLTQFFKGDRMTAEEVYMTPGHVLQTVGSESEAQLVLPRLQKMGIQCELVNDMPEDDFGEFDDPQQVVVSLVTCPTCGLRQVPADACRDCGQSFIVKREEKPLEEDEKPRARRDEESGNKLFGLLGGGIGFVLPSTGVMVGIALAAGGFFAMGGGGMLGLGGGKTADGNEEPPNAIIQIISGIMSSDSKEVASTMVYDPEANKNPYAERLKSLGIDQKKFSKSTGVEGGELSADQINAQLEKNPMMKKAIEGAINKSSRSTGQTETDLAIEGATGEAEVEASAEGSVEE